MRRVLSFGFDQRPAMVIDADRHLFVAISSKVPSGRSKAEASIRPIDNLVLFREGVHTQIKRAYELSVCLKGRRLYSPIIASAGVPG